MNKKDEFSIINIWFGMCVPMSIFNIILGILCDIFSNLCIILAVVMIMLWIKMLMIVYKEMKIWAGVV